MGGSPADTLHAFAAQLAIFQALLLAASAVHKAARWSHSITVVRHFAGVPRALAPPALCAVVVAELIAAALLVTPSYRTSGAVLAALLWSSYLALIIRAIVERRRDVDCGCSFGPMTRPLGSFHIARNTVLAGFAVGLAAVSAQGEGVPAQASQILAGFALLALYSAWDQVMAVAPLRRGELL